MFNKPLFSVALLLSASVLHAQSSSANISGLKAAAPATPAAPAAPAASSNSSTKDLDATKAPGADKADQLITNRNLRSLNGSLSTWSFASTWNYQGGDINKPIGSSRPNVTGSQDVALVQNLSGTVGINYRLNETNRLTLGMGLQMASPFSDNEDGKFTENGRREFRKTQGELDASNPQLTFRRVMKPFGVQSVLTVQSTYYTQDALVDRGLQSKNEAHVNALYDFGGSRFSAGVVVQGAVFTHSKDDKALQAGQAAYEFYALPITEFEISDLMNWRAVYRYNWYQQNRAQKSSEWTTLDPTISTGIGFTITRDVFIYPNIQFNPEDVRADRTNLGMSANINLF